MALKKPRIRLWFGLWVCADSVGVPGYGFSPARAYDDWLDRNKNRRLVTFDSRVKSRGATIDLKRYAGTYGGYRDG